MSTQTQDAKQAYEVWELRRRSVSGEEMSEATRQMHLEHARFLYNLIPEKERDLPEPRQLS